MPERVGEGLRALVVDDEEVVRSVVVEVLEGMGFLATPAESLTAGRQKLAVDRYDLLIIDKNLPDGSGLSMAHEVAERNLDAQVVIISGYATLSSAVEALQTGVADFVVKRSEEHSLNSSHDQISYAVFCLKKKKNAHYDRCGSILTTWAMSRRAPVQRVR